MPAAAATNGSMASDSTSQRQCRWAIVGCDAEATAFLQAHDTPKIPPRINGASKKGVERPAQASEASTSTANTTAHTIVAIASDASGADAKVFIEQNARTATGSPRKIRSDAKQGAYQAFDSVDALLEHDLCSTLNCIFVAGAQTGRYDVALAALRRGLGVLVCNPAAMTLGEADALCNEARQHQGATLGFVMLAKRQAGQPETLRAAADACAAARVDGKSESERLPWSQAIATIETLEELRESQVGQQSLMVPSGSSSPLETVTALEGKRPVSRSSMGSDRLCSSPLLGAEDGGTPRSTAALRSQLQELKHVLRHKTAVITALEQKAGVALGPPERQAVRPRNRSSLPPPRHPAHLETDGAGTSKRSPRISIDGSMHQEDEDDSYVMTDFPSVNEDQSSGAPFRNISNTSDAAFANGRRRRKDAGNVSLIGNDTRADATKASVKQLGLENIAENNHSYAAESPSVDVSVDPFLRAKRRVSTRASPRVPAALMSNGQSSPNSTSNASTKVSSSSAGDSRASASDGNEVVRDQLRISQRTVKALQRALDDERKVSAQASAEVTSLKERLAAKERYVDEVLGRARKAELESRDLGKSSREWGARVRKIEAELGEERMHKQRIEMQYEALASTWKHTREAWEKEMKALRENQGDAVRRNREDAQSIIAKFKSAQEAWTARDSAGSELRSVLGALQREREKAAKEVQTPVAKLTAALDKHEARTTEQDEALADVVAELQRIKRLMREPLKK